MICFRKRSVVLPVKISPEWQGLTALCFDIVIPFSVMETSESKVSEEQKVAVVEEEEELKIPDQIIPEAG